MAELPVALHRQPEPFGCIYYSFASMANLPRAWAERYERDCSYERFVVRAWREGFMLRPYYVSDDPCGADWWRSKHPEPGDTWHWHVCIPSLTWRETKHMVGVVQTWGHDDDGEPVPVVEVYDTAGFDDVQFMSVDEFLASPYASAFEILLVNTNRVSSWQPVWPDDAPHILDPDGMRLEVLESD